MRRGRGHTLRDVLIKIHNHVGHHVVCGSVDVKFHEILHGDILFDILEHVPLLFHIVSLLFEN
jgi:hypothetical protein